jgi:beta-lactamase class A
LSRRATIVAVALTALVATGLAACAGGAAGPDTTPSASSPPAAAPAPAAPSAVATAFPTTPAGRQLAWVVARMNAGQAVGAAALAQHFSATFLAQVPPAQLVAALTQVAAAGPLRLVGLLGPSAPTALVAHLDGAAGASLKVSIVVGAAAPNLIGGLLFAPYSAYSATPVPTGWRQVDTGLRALAGHATMVATEVGQSTPLHALQADTPGAIGSAFKLYVLGALGSAVAHGSASWNERLAVHAAWKSLPSGDLRTAPNGRRYTLRYFAQQMIAVSDNTAADHLIHRLGRPAVEAELAAMGMRAPQLDTPFLTTRELFALKLSAPPSLRDAWAGGTVAQRRRLLARIDALPVSLADATGWTAPREVSTIEWFASPADLARAMVALRAASQRPGLAPISQILAKNPGLPLDRKTWPYVAFKGGSEPGVLSLTWLLTRRDGHSFVLSIVLNDTAGAIDEAGAVNVAEGAVGLLAKAR